MSPIGQPRRGQLVIVGPYPFGPHPNSDDNPFFMDELEKCPLDVRQRILADYVSAGMNEIILGPAFVARGYDGQYPPTDWRMNPILDVAEECNESGLQITLAVLPDCAPYFDGSKWDLDAYFADFGTILRSLLPYVTNLQLAWETVTSSAETCRAISRVRAELPGVPLDWHNPPGHLSPCLSSEDEQAGWRAAAAAGIAGLAMQASPPGSDTVRPPIDQMAYDLNDMYRRFQGQPGSPWGGPVLGLDGKPLRVWYREGVAYAIYHGSEPESIANTWALAALDVPGITESGDGR